ncbi:purine nucleoside phosphorylase I, inosine and guanosine-specific, partial [gut metagenome]
MRVLRKKTNFVPRVALILGSGLGDYAKGIQVQETIPYGEIQGFPVSTVPGHKGQFVFGYVKDVPVVIMQGRVHYYEGYEMTDVV